jgi:ferredoxin
VAGNGLLIVLGVLLAALLVLWIFGERGRLMRRSTWEALRGGGLRNLLNLKSLHGYIYSRWTNQYLDILFNRIVPRLGDRGKKWWRDRYHAKILTQELAEAMVLLDHDIERRDLEQIIPYPMARDLVLKGPPDVAAYECGCRHTRAHPCQPTQVCMVMGQPFVDFTLEHNPKSSRRLTQPEAVELLRAEHKRGHLHSAWFRDICSNRFYVLCNCCKCCCGGIEAMVKHGGQMMASSGYVSQVDEKRCTSCGVCVEACPFGALSMDEIAVVSWEKCLGCGVCTGQCPTGAITLVRDERKGVPLDVRLLA